MGILNFFKEKINKGELNKLEDQALLVEELEPQMQKLSDEELQKKTEEFRERIKAGETLDDLLVEAFAVVREACVRTLGQRPYHVQIVGGIVLHQGRITEMKTGEGKTLTATMPLYLNALEGKGAHLVTVNDYLATYQSMLMSKVFHFLGMTVGCLTNDVEGEERKEQYERDITYGTNNEFGFDYLRDNMVIYAEERVQRPLNYAIVDEVDSILIDEARTPLIISGRGRKSTDGYSRANAFVKTLKEDDVIIDEKQKTIVLTDEALKKAEAFYRIENMSDPENMETSHHVNQAIRAKFLMHRDIDYVVKDGEVLIVDEFTGRIMEGRRYSNGLHQAIEAKENIEVKKETQTLATITLQNFFRMYQKLAGMTGTAKTEEEEFRDIYGMDVVVVPTNKPVIREDLADLIFGNKEFKYKAIVDEIQRRHETGQPLLVGTISIEVSELLSSMLKKRGIKHDVLNAKQHARESEIIAQAGHFGAVTIATNMAGRGTDIMLGGNVEFILRKELRKEQYSDEVISKALSPFHYEEEDVIRAKEFIQSIRPKIEEEVNKNAEEVRKVGGLHVLGTERHESRRIDNQLRGRSGRQGDPGSSQFFLSLDDDLLRIFMNENFAGMLNRMGLDSGEPLQHSMLTKQVENAQKKVESNHYGSRAYVLQYDQVMNEQRKYIYAERNKVLENDDLKEHILSMVHNVISGIVDNYTSNRHFEEWDVEGLHRALKEMFTNVAPFEKVEVEKYDPSELKERYEEIADKIYEEREDLVGPERMREFERRVLLLVVDNHWIDHIDDMDNLKQGINLRSIGQINPIQAYQTEGFEMYEEMIQAITEETVRTLYGAKIEDAPIEREQVVDVMAEGEAQKTPMVRTERKVGRNEPCPCGSGKKYKNCCGRS
ncbi:preprotein translocase subunit SecA [Guggenheimella bovis]